MFDDLIDFIISISFYTAILTLLLILLSLILILVSVALGI